MSEAGGALDNVKEAFQGKRGKILLIGGGIAIAGYVWWTRRNGTTETLPTDTTASTGTAAAAGASPQSDPTVGNTSTGSTSSARPANNAEWLSAGTDVLIGRGTPGSAAYDALTKALGGLPTTTQQQAWVSQVIDVIGVPPDGMPPLNAAAPAGTGSTQGNPKPKPKPAPKPKPKPAPKPKPKPGATYIGVPVKAFSKSNPRWDSTISGIAGHYGKSWASVWNDPRNASLRAKRKSTDKIQPGDIVYVKK